MKTEGTLDVTVRDFIHVAKRICDCIRGRYNELTQSSPPPETRPHPGQDSRNSPEADPATCQHRELENDSEDASMITGLSPDNSCTSSLDLCDEDKTMMPKLKMKSVPRRVGGEGESFVWLWLKGSEETTPLNNLCTTLSKVVTVIISIDSEASFQCVYDEANSTWTDPDTKEKIKVTPIRQPEDVPTARGLVEKYFEVQWARMLTDRRGRKDKKGKQWKQMSISGTLLLSSLVCDKYLCNKVNSSLSSDGLRLNVKPIQVLRTEIIACVICISNSVCLVAVKSFLMKICRETEQSMFSRGKHQAHLDKDFPEFQLARRPAQEPDIPEKYRSKDWVTNTGT